MPSLAEDRLSVLLAEWIDENRPEDLPSEVPVLLASRGETRACACVVLETGEDKPVPKDHDHGGIVRGSTRILGTAV
jgi:hypothetical protein